MTQDTPWIPGWTGDEIEAYEEEIEFMNDKKILVSQMEDVN